MKKRILGIFLIFIITIALFGCGNGEKPKTRVITSNVQKESNVKNNVKSQKEKGKLEVDTSIYIDYKGPVQGEIKYQEGRPATQNSRNLKASGDIGSPYHVDLIVTRDFGHTNMFAKNVGLVKDEVGMEILFRNLDIQTAYGGGFVNIINGLESQYTFYSGSEREKLDWFYWVNGILAPVGVAEYRPSPDDVIWWDYHEWETTMFIPVIIGSYPQPFKNGFWGNNPGTIIMYTSDYKDKAQILKESLIEKGVESIDIAAYDPSSIEKPEKYYILLGKWEELSKNSKRLEEMNWRNKLEGIYVEFKDGKLNALDNTGKVIKSHDDAGAIYATSAGMGCTVPVWLVTGNTDAGVDKALDVLLNEPENIKDHFEVVVTDEGIEQVPYID